MILVIAFHAGMASMVGGYLGVDVFFVLSGFLITGLLLTAGDAGSVGLVKFYSRRARRLLPVALVVLLATAVLWLAIAGSVEREPLVGDIRSAALYFSNWHFAAQATDYFASSDDPSPFVHFWSLSAEEQFYLVWPALIALAYLGARGSRRRAAWIVASLASVLGAASLASLWLSTHDGHASYAYFATHNRAYQLLAGALLAVWAHRRRVHRVRQGEPALGAATGPELGVPTGGHRRPTDLPPWPPVGGPAGPAGSSLRGGRHAVAGVYAPHAAGAHAAGAHAAGTHAAGTQAASTHGVGAYGSGTHESGAHGAGTYAAGAHANVPGARVQVPAAHLPYTTTTTALGVGAARAAHAARPAGSADAERAMAGLPAWLLAGAIQLLAAAGLVVVASSKVQLGSGTRGALAAAITLVLLAALELLPTAAGGWLLGRSPIAYIGRISYGAYLWHWPVILVIRRFVVISPHQLFVVAGVMSIALASLSHRLLEEPVRRSPALARRPRVSIAGGLALSLVVSLLLGPQLMSAERKPVIFPVADSSAPATTAKTGTPAAGAPERGLPPTNSRTPVPTAAQIKDASAAYGVRHCEQELKDAGRGCLDHTGSPGRPVVMVIGDSHLEALFQTFDQMAVEHDFTLYTWIYFVCPWEKGVLPKDADGSTNEAACRGRKAEMHDNMLAKIRPDVVIGLHRGYDDPSLPRPLLLEGQPQYTTPGAVLSAAAPAAAADILQYAKKLVVLEPWPSLKTNQRSCLSRQQYIEQCRSLAETGKLPSERAFEAVAAKNSRVATIDLDKMVCPALPVCDAVQGGVLVRRDFDHLTNPMGLRIKPLLAAALQRVGVFGP